MARLDQVPRPETASECVIHGNHVAPSGAAADEDRRDLVLQGLLHGPGVAGKRKEDDAGDPVFQQGLDAGELTLAVAFGVAEHGGVPPRGSLALDRLRHLGEKRVGEIAHDHAQDAGALLDELAGEDVGPVAELADRRPHPPARCFRDARQSAHHVGHRRFRNPRVRGDVKDGRVPAHRGRGIVRDGHRRQWGSVHEDGFRPSSPGPSEPS